MTDSQSWFVGWFGDFYLASSVLLAVVLIVGKFVRQSAMHIAMAWGTLGGLTVLAVLCASPRPTAFHLGDFVAHREPSVTHGVEAGTEFTSLGTRRVADGIGSTPAPLTSLPTSSSPTLGHGRPRLDAKSSEELAPVTSGGDFRQSGGDSTSWVAGALAAGLLISTARMVIGFAQSRRLLAMASHASGDLERIFRELTSEAECVELLTSHQVATPVAMGLRRPRVVLPSSYEDGQPESFLRLALAHELAHIRHGDLALLAAVRWLAVSLGAHPMFWAWRRKVRFAQETLADAAAAEGADPADYADAMVAWARQAKVRRTAACFGAMGLWESRSQLRRRIAVILDDTVVLKRVASRRWKWTTGVACCASAWALSQFTTSPESPKAARAATASEPAGELTVESPPAVTTDILTQVVEAATPGTGEIRSARVHVDYVVTGGPFQAGLTPQRCGDVVATCNFSADQAALATLVNQVCDLPKPATTPGTPVELFHLVDAEHGVMVRESRSRGEGKGSDEHVRASGVALQWDESNAQMDVRPIADDWLGMLQLANLWPSLQWLQKVKAFEMQRGAHGETLLTHASDGGRMELAVDAVSSLPIRLTLEQHHGVEAYHWLSWTDAFGVAMPRAVVQFTFQNGQLNMLKCHVVRDVRLNVPIDAAIFRLGVPAGAVVVDHRSDGVAMQMNRDVFDVTSQADVFNASRLQQREFTQVEREAFAELDRDYRLLEGEAVRRFGPPYPLARNYLPLMLAPQTAQRPNREQHYILERRDGKLVRRFASVGSPLRVRNLVGVLLRHPIVDVDVSSDILERPMPGDYLLRAGETTDLIAAGISSLISEDLGRAVTLEFVDVEREVYVARGELKVNREKTGKYEDRPMVYVNSGDYDGDHGERIGFGKASGLVSEVAEYIDVKIIDETMPSTIDLAWSSRWYGGVRGRNNPPFQIEPARVLEQLSRQTGLAFAKETRRVSVLRLNDPAGVATPSQ
ncbi:MAG: M56 family metallopeptidase [Planctomycetales bacterium]|nr:M56 family metallopeptidase [Planctomycetales bacterium]